MNVSSIFSGHDGLRRALAVGLAAVCAASSGEGGADAATRLLVIDPGTFVEMPAETPLMRASRGRGGRGGPRIELRLPGLDSVYRAGEPMTLYAEFFPAADGAAPDMATLAVRVRKGRRGKDITDVVRAYVDGTAIRVPAMDFSGHAGEFRFELDILDERGRMSGAEFRVTFRLDFRDSSRLDDEA